MKLWLKLGDAAEYAGVCRDTIYTACDRREIRHVSIRLKREWIDDWYERGARAAVRPPSANEARA